MSTFFEILQAQRGRPSPLRRPTTTVPEVAATSTLEAPVVQAPEAPLALVIDATDRGVSTITTRLETASLGSADRRTRIAGRYVGAEAANRNGAFWSVGDLEFGVGSVAGGPINWLHKERMVLGAIESASLHKDGPHIEVSGSLWDWLYPREVATLRGYAESGQAWFSMECVAEKIECVGPNGCGRLMPYEVAVRRTPEACDHIRERSSHRRFVNPMFMGAGLIVPPAEPGWANAHLDIVRDASHLAEAAAFGEGDDPMIAARILDFVRNGAETRV